jgi:hypothetical protein
MNIPKVIKSYVKKIGDTYSRENLTNKDYENICETIYELVNNKDIEEIKTFYEYYKVYDERICAVLFIAPKAFYVDEFKYIYYLDGITGYMHDDIVNKISIYMFKYELTNDFKRQPTIDIVEKYLKNNIAPSLIWSIIVYRKLYNVKMLPQLWESIVRSKIYKSSYYHGYDRFIKYSIKHKFEGEYFNILLDNTKNINYFEYLFRYFVKNNQGRIRDSGCITEYHTEKFIFTYLNTDLTLHSAKYDSFSYTLVYLQKIGADISYDLYPILCKKNKNNFTIIDYLLYYRRHGTYVFYNDICDIVVQHSDDNVELLKKLINIGYYYNKKTAEIALKYGNKQCHKYLSKICE